MNITAAHQQTVTGLLDAAELASLSKGTELRSKSGTNVLYEKQGGSFFRSLFPSSARVQKQNEARSLVNQALKNEFAGVDGGATFEQVVRKNMRKELSGTGKVTVGDLDKIKTEIERVKDTYKSYKLSKGNLASDPQFEAGRKQFSTVVSGIKGFKAGMDSFDAVELYTKVLNGSPKPLTDQVKRELGALGAYVKELGCQTSDLADLVHSAEVVQAAVDHGATSVKALPQMIPLRQFGNAKDQEGRCLGLVTLTALAEARKPQGGDHVMHRMEHEVHEMRKDGLRERNDYAKDLESVHTKTSTARTPIVGPEGAKITTIGHRRAVDHLAASFASNEGKPLMYGVQTEGHMMMIGATRHEGQESFVFYDPCMGISRFQNKEDLSRFLDHYFGELEFGKEFNMKNLEGDGFEFAAVGRFDTTVLAGLPLGGAKILDMIQPSPPPPPAPTPPSA